MKTIDHAITDYRKISRFKKKVRNTPSTKKRASFIFFYKFPSLCYNTQVFEM